MNHTKNALEDAASFYCRGRWGRWGAGAILCLALVASGFSQALVGGFAIIAGPQGEYLVFAGQFQQPLRSVSATCVNEAQGEQRIVLSGANVFPGFVLSITPGSGWVWQPGEKLVVRSPSLDEPLVFAIPPDSHPRWSAFVAQARALGARLSGLSWATGAPSARPFDPNADLMAPGYEPETVAGGSRIATARAPTLSRRPVASTSSALRSSKPIPTARSATAMSSPPTATDGARVARGEGWSGNCDEPYRPRPS